MLSVQSGAVHFLVGIYVFYQLKKRQIYLNYTFLESDDYYHRVWKNIGKFALWILCTIGISMAILLLMPALRALSPLLAVNPEGRGQTAGILLGQYIALLLGGSILYLFLSLLERESYQKLCGLSRSLGRCLVAATVFYGLSSVYSLLLLYTAESHLQLWTTINTYAPNLNLYWHFSLVMFLVYFAYESQRQHPHRAIGFGCKCIILTLAISQILNCYSAPLLQIFIRTSMYIQFMQVYQILLSLKANASALLVVLGGGCILIALVRQGILRKRDLAILPVILADFVISALIKQPAISAGIRSHYARLSTLALMIWLCFLVFRAIRSCDRAYSPRD